MAESEREKTLRVVKAVFGSDVAKSHAGRVGDELPQPTRRVINEYDPQERGLGS